MATFLIALGVVGYLAAERRSGLEEHRVGCCQRRRLTPTPYWPAVLEPRPAGPLNLPEEKL